MKACSMHHEFHCMYALLDNALLTYSELEGPAAATCKMSIVQLLNILF